MRIKTGGLPVCHFCPRLR